MTYSMAFFTFINAWWIMLFFVLPFSISAKGEAGPADYAAAPRSVRWKKVVIMTTILSLLVTGAMAFIIHKGMMTLRT